MDWVTSTRAACHADPDEARRRDTAIPFWALLLLCGLEGTRRDVEELRRTVLRTQERAA
jgi:MYXO-CTERM domain-containing protein